MRERINFRSMGLALMLLTLMGVAQGAEVYQDVRMLAGFNWTTPAAGYWSPDTPNTPGNNYWVGTMTDGITRTPGTVYNTRMDCRTVDALAAPETFLGSRLTISTSGTLFMKNNTANSVTVPDLRMQGNTPRINCGNTGILELNGAITNNANVTSYMHIMVADTSSQRHINLTAKLSGPGQTRLEGGNAVMDFADHGVELSNNTNDFTGRIYTYRNAKLIVNQANGLGNTSGITIATVGQFINNVVIVQPTKRLFLMAGSKTTLNQNATFGEVYITSATRLAPATYDVATLSAINPSVLFAGTGSLTVAGIAPTANVDLVASMAAGDDWRTPGQGYWSPDAPNLPGSTYYVGTKTDGITRPDLMGANTRWNFRTPNLATIPHVFLGDRLILSSSGTLVLRQATGNSVTIPDLRVQGGNLPRIDCNNTGILELNGVLTNNTNPAVSGSYLNFLVNGTVQKWINLTAKLTGPGYQRVEGQNSPLGTYDHALVLNNNTNDFTGQIYTVNDAKIICPQVNSLGNTTTVTIANMGSLYAMAAMNKPNINLILQTGSQTSITQSVTFRSIRLPGNTQVRKGTWTAAQVNALSPVIFVLSPATVTVGTGLPDIGITQSGNPITSITFVNQNPVLGWPLNQVITLTNTGDAPLIFNPNYNTAGFPGLDLDPLGNPMFTVVSAVPSTATPLAAGGTIALTVRMNALPGDYVPGNPNTYTGALNIRTNALNSNFNVNLPINGNTVPVEMSTFTTQ